MFDLDDLPPQIVHGLALAEGLAQHVRTLRDASLAEHKQSLLIASG